MSALKRRKILGRIGVVFGIIALLMLFVVPFFIPQEIGNDKTYAAIFFVSFLIFMFIGNITMEKSSKPLSLEEERDEKISQIIN